MIQYGMTYFNRGGSAGRSQYYNPREGSGFGSRSNDRGSERKEMFDAVCAKCGGVAKVPFRPNGRKDVFCSKCFGEMNGEEPRGGNRFESRGNDRGYSDRPRFEKPSFRAICDECGDNCEVPFEPRNGKPVLCSDCFAKKEGRGNESRNSVDLAEINAKLDRIIKILSPEAPKKEMTEKILEEIEAGLGKKVTVKKAKTNKKKIAKTESES